MKFITPKNAEKFANAARLPALWLALLCFVVGLAYALFASPADYQQGQMVRVMYIHVPAAWMSLCVYSFMAAMGFGFIVWRNPLCYLMAREAAPIGACFTAVCLITGSLWGIPTWGTWWVWDARLTSMLILFFLYLGFMGLNGAFHSEEKEAKSASVLVMVGAINLPIIKYSVEWWNTLHQPASVFRMAGSAVDKSMLTPLLLMALSATFLFVYLICIRTLTALWRKKLTSQINP